jgi:hypothetical protein
MVPVLILSAIGFSLEFARGLRTTNAHSFIVTRFRAGAATPALESLLGVDEPSSPQTVSNWPVSPPQANSSQFGTPGT